MAPPKSYQVQAITESPMSALGEAPHWDVARQSLYYVDIGATAPTILRYDFLSEKIYAAVVGKSINTYRRLGNNFNQFIENISAPITFIIPVVGSRDQFAISTNGTVVTIKWNGLSETATVVRQVVAIESGRRMNDAKADPFGRLYCGIMTMKEDLFVNTADANVWRYDGRTADKRTALTGLGLPNGLTWNLKRKKFYFVDSLAFDVKEYDYDADSGEVGMHIIGTKSFYLK